MELNIGIVGGGAKAAAIAAKSETLNRVQGMQINTFIFEPKEIGANWSGHHGYTDGAQRLCSPSERDLGFPYLSNFGEEVSQQLFEKYSWQSFLISNEREYSRWVDHGRKSATHSDFQQYLGWAIERSDALVIPRAVKNIKLAGNGWGISTGSKREDRILPSFDGIVITGPGPAKRIAHTRSVRGLYDGTSFWSSLDEIKNILKDNKFAPIVVLGGGGTGAATLAWLCRSGFGENPTHLVASQATLFSRGDSVFENNLFTDELLWMKLSPENRIHFFNRLNRGVVWNSVMGELERFAGLTLLDGRAERIYVRGGKLAVMVQHWNRTKTELEADLVVDASGFDAWWFRSLLTGVSGAKRWSGARRKQLQDGLRETLDFDWSLPPLHVPGLSDRIGPGFGSLMSLGGMSDRVLSRYLNVSA